MKRILSWIVLAISMFVSGKIIQLIVYLGTGIANRLYNSSRGLFWLIIFVGGSFGLGIAYAFSFGAAATCVNLSEKVYPSVKGTRYMTGAIIMGLLFLIDFILCFTTGIEGIMFARQIIIDCFAVVFSFLLFVTGKNRDET